MSVHTRDVDQWILIAGEFARDANYGMASRVNDALAARVGDGPVSVEFSEYENQYLERASLRADHYRADSDLGKMIEALAQTEYTLNLNRRVAHIDWNQLPEGSREHFRGRTVRNYLPIIRDFVERWIGDCAGSGEEVSRVWLADTWRRETGDE